MTPKNLILENPHPAVQVIKISRPEALNALNVETLLELRTTLSIVAENPAIRVLVLTGAGEKSFVAGADIVEMKDKTPSEAVDFARIGQEVTKLLEMMPKITIAAVNGFALGGGTEMAIACDFILAAENAVFGQPEVGLGIIPGFGGTVRLSKFVGLPMAKELIFSGRKVKAEEALKIGLANHVYPSGDLMNEALKLAQTIIANGPLAVNSTKRLLNEFSETVGINYKLDSEAQEFGNLFGGAEQREGMTAFVEKRKPQFR